MKQNAGFLRRQWHARPLMVFSVCFLTGILLADRFSFGIFLPLTGAAAALGADFLLCRLKRRWFVLPMLAACLLGAARMEIAVELNPPVESAYSVEFEGVVISEPVYKEETDRLVAVFRLTEIDGRSADARVRLYLRSSELPLEGIEYGQTLRCFGHVWPQEHATNPHQFDSMNWLLSDGMTGMAAAKMEDVGIVSQRSDFYSLILGMRKRISERIDILFPQNTELVRAFVLGDRNNLNTELRSSFSKTGVAHLICISGMHVSVLAYAVSLLLRRFLPRNAAILISVGFVTFYGFLIGFPPSLVRAVLMFAVLSFAPIAGYPSDSPTRLAFAMLLMLMARPFFIYDTGFVLSFSSSAGIILLNPALERLICLDRIRVNPYKRPKNHRVLYFLKRILAYFASVLCSTLAAQLASLPAVIAYFGAQSLISVPVNLIAVPLAMCAYPIALAAVALSFIWTPFGIPVAFVSDSMFSLLVRIIRSCSMLPVSQLRSPEYPDWLLILHCCAVAAASSLSKIRASVRRFLALIPVGMIGVSVLCAWIGCMGFDAVFLDAGQADAAVVCAEGNVLLFDVGDVYSPVADYVSASCIGVDAVFLSHPHYDHVAGLAGLVETMPPEVIYVPDGWYGFDASDAVRLGISAAEEAGIPVIELSPGDEVCFSENVTVRIHGADIENPDGNELSMIAELVYCDSRILFTGDLPEECEPEEMDDVDVLKVAHHGSDKSSGEEFLEMIRPEVAVISVGENSYGHPSPETISRLKAVGAEVYRTDECGAVTVNISKDGDITVQTYFPVEEAS